MRLFNELFRRLTGESWIDQPQGHFFEKLGRFVHLNEADHDALSNQYVADWMSERAGLRFDQKRLAEIEAIQPYQPPSETQLKAGVERRVTLKHMPPAPSMTSAPTAPPAATPIATPAPNWRLPNGMIDWTARIAEMEAQDAARKAGLSGLGSLASMGPDSPPVPTPPPMGTFGQRGGPTSGVTSLFGSRSVNPLVGDEGEDLMEIRRGGFTDPNALLPPEDRMYLRYTFTAAPLPTPPLPPAPQNTAASFQAPSFRLQAGIQKTVKAPAPPPSKAPVATPAPQQAVLTLQQKQLLTKQYIELLQERGTVIQGDVKFEANGTPYIDRTGRLLEPLETLKHFKGGSGYNIRVGIDDLKIQQIDLGYTGSNSTRISAFRRFLINEINNYNYKTSKLIQLSANKQPYIKVPVEAFKDVIPSKVIDTQFFDNWGVYGNVTFKLLGTVTLNPNGTWELIGQVKSYDDPYDANASNHRGFAGLLGTYTLSKIKGKQFDIQIRGQKLIHMKGFFKDIYPQQNRLLPIKADIK